MIAGLSHPATALGLQHIPLLQSPIPGPIPFVPLVPCATADPVLCPYVPVYVCAQVCMRVYVCAQVCMRVCMSAPRLARVEHQCADA